MSLPVYLGPNKSVGLASGDRLTADNTGWALAADASQVRITHDKAGPGFAIVATVDPVVTSANRPTQGLVGGLCVFDGTLGKPIWRNAANSGWVDATGTGV